MLPRADLPGEGLTRVDFEQLRSLGAIALYATTFVVALVSGLVPYVLSFEVFVLAVATLTNAPIAPIVGLGVLGPAITKYILYLAGTGTLNISWVRRTATARAAEAFARHPHASLGVVLSSAAFAVPPLYPTSVIAGTLRLPQIAFVLVVAAGSIVRYSALFLAPKLIRPLF